MSKCLVKNVHGKVTGVTLENGEESNLFKRIAQLPFIKDNEEALQYYAYTLTPQFKKSAKDLIKEKNNEEPVLVFRNLSDNNKLLNSSGLIFSTDYNAENKNDIQGEGILMGFLRRGKEQKNTKVNKSDEKIVDNDIPRYLYHATPSSRGENIRKEGIRVGFDSKIYLTKTFDSAADIANQLHNTYKEKDIKFYHVVRIDTTKLPKDISFYKDNDYNAGVYIEQSIPKDAVKHYESVKVELSNISVLESQFSEAIENMDRQSVLEMTYPDGSKKYAVQNQNLFVQLEKFNKNVTPESYDGFIAELERQGVPLETKIYYSPSQFKKGTRTAEAAFTLYKGVSGKKNADGSIRTAHPNAQGTFTTKDEKVAERYKGDQPLQSFEIPAGTTIETIRVDAKSVPIDIYREIETELINNSTADIVELRTTDATGKETQYILKKDFSSAEKPQMNRMKVGDTTIYYKDRINPITNKPTGEIELDLIKTEEAGRNKGSAKEALKQFVDFADKQKKDVYLFVRPASKGITEAGLTKLYEGFGFRSSPVFPQEMIRQYKGGINDRIAQRIRNKKIVGAFSAIDFGLTQTIYNAALEFMAQQVENGTSLGNAIAKTLKWIDGENGGQKWEKGKFAKYMNDQYKVRFQGKEVEVVRDDSKEMKNVIRGFYSPLEQVILNSKTDKAKGKEWLKKLSNIEADELKWTGVADYLNANKENTITAQELKQWMQDNRVEVVEIQKGTEVSRNYQLVEEPPKELGITRFEALDVLSIAGNIDNPRLPEYLNRRFGDEKGRDILLYLQNNAEDLGDYVEDVKYSQYVVEGDKTNYKEILVTYPNINKVKLQGFAWQKMDSSNRNVWSLLGVDKNGKIRQGVVGSADESVLLAQVYEIDGKYDLTAADDAPSQYKDFEQTFDTLEEAQNFANQNFTDNKQFEQSQALSKFQSSHWDEPNILVHLRVDTRVDSEGNKVLFIEEIQSDWGQKGKRKGFATDLWKESDYTYSENLEEDGVKGFGYLNKDNQIAIFYPDLKRNKEASEAKREVASVALNDVIREHNEEVNRLVPNAPFVTDTNSWVRLGLKVALKEAVAQGVTTIAWTTGEQQNERYDLSQYLDDLTYDKNESGGTIIGYMDGKLIVDEKNIPESKLADYVGKEAAERLINSYDENGRANISGGDLKFGGKGMIGFYGSPKEDRLGILGQQAMSLFKEDLKKIKIENIKTKPTNYNDFNDYMSNTVSVENTEDVKKYSKSGYRFLDASNNIIDKNKAYELIERGQKLRAVIDSNSTQHAITITPALSNTVAKGLPLFGKIEIEEDTTTPSEDNIITDLSLDQKIEILIQNGDIERSCLL